MLSVAITLGAEITFERLLDSCAEIKASSSRWRPTRAPAVSATPAGPAKPVADCARLGKKAFDCPVRAVAAWKAELTPLANAPVSVTE